jgi:hypothetical protein
VIVTLKAVEEVVRLMGAPDLRRAPKGMQTKTSVFTEDDRTMVRMSSWKTGSSGLACRDTFVSAELPLPLLHAEKGSLVRCVDGVLRSLLFRLFPPRPTFRIRRDSKWGTTK